MHMLLALIIALVILIVIAIMVLVPGVATGEWSNKTLSFKDACFFWSTNSPAYSGTTTVKGGQIIDMTELCEDRLGAIQMKESDWDRCRNACRGL